MMERPKLRRSNYTRILQEILLDDGIKISREIYEYVDRLMYDAFVKPLADALRNAGADAVANGEDDDAFAGALNSVLAKQPRDVRKLCRDKCARAVEAIAYASRSYAPLRERVQSIVCIDEVYTLLERVAAASKPLNLEDTEKVYIGMTFETMAYLIIEDGCKKMNES